MNGAIDDGSPSYPGKYGEEVARVEVVGEDLKYGHTQRKLKSRHIQLIALGKLLLSGGRYFDERI